MKKKTRPVTFLIVTLSVISTALYIYIHHAKQNEDLPLAQLSQSAEPATKHYEAQKFDLAGKLKGLSPKQITEHETLYRRYVEKRNEIAEKLKTADRSGANTTYSPYRDLKIAQTFAMNADILHRLYFENLGVQKSQMGPQMQTLIEESFGSIDKFKEDLYAAAQSARGWVLTSYTLDDGYLENYVLDAHNLTVPIMVIPLLILDVYEHAYMIDFGIDRKKYLDIFWENINWDVIEQRINKWVNVFRRATAEQENQEETESKIEHAVPGSTV